MVTDPTGREWIRADEAPQHVGSDITAGILAGWEASGRVKPRRVGRAVWYAVDELREAEYETRTGGRGWKRGRPRRAGLDPQDLPG